MEEAQPVGSSEPTTRRMRVRRSFAALRGKTEPVAPTTPGRKSRFKEDASVGGALLPNNEVTPEPHSLAKAGRMLAGMNPLNVLRSIAKTYTTTKDDIIIQNIEHNRMQSTTSLASESHNPHILRQSASKKDLREQRRLSKRVSDLEIRLEKARKALDTSIQKSSPMPIFPSPYEKYKPKFALNSRKSFTPGLPTLHSEGVLFPDINTSQQSVNHRTLSQSSFSEVELQKPLPPTPSSAGEPQEPHEHRSHLISDDQDLEFDRSFSDISDHMDDIQITDSSPNKGFYMQNNSSIVPATSRPNLLSNSLRTDFYMNQNASLLPEDSPRDVIMADEQNRTERIDSFTDLASLNSEDATPTQNKPHPPSHYVTAEHDDTTPTQTHASTGAEPDTPSQPIDLKTKLATLNNSVKARAKASKPKKRKSNDDGDKTFRPDGNDDDSDDSDGPARLKKRRKSSDKTNGTAKAKAVSAKKTTATATKKATPRKITKPAPAEHLLTPAFELRGRHSGETSRRLDMIQEDEEMDTDSPLPAAQTTTNDVGSLPAEVENPTTPRADHREMADAAVVPAGSSVSPTTTKPTTTAPNPITATPDPTTAVPNTTTPTPAELTEKNLERHDAWDWPDDVF
ncbi:hypothetical protein BDZ85DRAFT_280231 [Elsinoe ampelina]|uniref:Uncharacterized protein n=1 Tax=Elsinoe ampelina TaxID=302913 RepID=A0A6A6GHD8_9PEZI|nr:hypothetical protein BDZ85DRAFT_280231 [Elsinoe ampelina]